MGQLTGQRAFITGGASGIGAEMARRFTKEGATVVVADVNDTLGKQVAAEVGGEYVHLDVTSAKAWEEQYEIDNNFDIVCLNAGVSTHQNVLGDPSSYPLERVDNDSYYRIMSINVDGVVFGARGIVPHMVARKSGHILVTASLAGIIPIAPDPIYGLTKHAMVGFVKSMGQALEPHGVCISALCPGFLDTPLVSPLAREFASTFSLGVMPVEVAGDLAMRALSERINGSQWVVSAGFPIARYEHKDPFAG
jgi:NAD(P)-dependent dehydrogenase (short-subunit alcohol dehydrogenase family)